MTNKQEKKFLNKLMRKHKYLTAKRKSKKRQRLTIDNSNMQKQSNSNQNVKQLEIGGIWSKKAPWPVVKRKGQIH